VTTNQLVALSFPLVTAAAVGLTALLIRRPWAERREADADTLPAEIVTVLTPSRELLDAVERLTRDSLRIRARLMAEPAERVETPHS
jgi:hypothetical protein